MPRLLDANFDEILLLPQNIEDWIPAESPARFIRQFVAELDPTEFQLHRDTEASTEGRPAFAFALLWRVWLYGYVCRIRTCRKLEAACRERLDFIWLSGDHRPDHNTLWRFWQTHRKALRTLFRRTVKVACELKLVGLVLQAIDGTKIQAACSGRQGWDRAALQKVLARLETQITALEAEIARTGAAAEATAPATTLPPELTHARELQAKVAAALQKVTAKETRYCSPHEPEARRMPCEGGKRFGYNAQIAVDAQAQIIVAAEVVTAETDQGQLGFMLAQATAHTGVPAAHTDVDGGYCTGAQIAAAQADGYDVFCPIPRDPKTPADAPYHVSRFRYDETTDTMICPQGQPLPFKLARARNGTVSRVYQGVGAICRACPAFGLCTKERRGRIVERWPWSDVMDAHRLKMATPAAQATYAQRCHIVEPVFGWIKSAWDFRRWTWQGLEKVQAQWHLLCATSNLRALYRVWRSEKSQSTGISTSPLTRRPRRAESSAGQKLS